MGLGAVAADRSYNLSVTPFEQNIEIKTLKTFGLGAAAPAPGLHLEMLRLLLPVLE